MDMQKLYLLVPLAPLLGAAIAGLFCRVIPRWVAHTAAIAGVVMYLAIGAWGAAFTPPHFLLAMPLLFAAGWARGAFLTWTEGRATSVADSAVENLKDRLRKTIVGEPQDPYRRDYRRRPEPTNPDDREP